MRFEFTLAVEVERDQGKFASREEMEEQIREAVEGADPGELEGENGGTYNVIQWEVTNVVPG